MTKITPFKRLAQSGLRYLEREDKVFFAVFGFLYGIIFCLCYTAITSQTGSGIKMFLETYIANDSEFYGALAGIAATFISIAIPISNDTIASQLQVYYSPEISRIFYSNKRYTWQKRNAGILFLLTMILFLWKLPTNSSNEDIPNALKSAFTIFTAIWFIWSVIWFYIFIKHVQLFVVNAEEQVEKYLKEKLEDEINR